MWRIGIFALARMVRLCHPVSKVSHPGMDMAASRIAGAGLALAILTISAHPAFAGEAAVATQPAAPTPAAIGQPQPTPWVAADFAVPTLVQGPGFQLVPLGPDVVKVDFDAYMSSIEHLQKTFSRSTSWPHPGITAADSMQDMQTEQARFTSRQSFAYAVLTPDGHRELGSVYVSPSPVAGYDAVVRMWVTKADYDAGFDAELFKWVMGWVRKEWPFRNVAYPGRVIEWGAWDPLVTATKAGAAAPAGPKP